jgi:hypothetical protein
MVVSDIQAAPRLPPADSGPEISGLKTILRQLIARNAKRSPRV